MLPTITWAGRELHTKSGRATSQPVHSHVTPLVLQLWLTHLPTDWSSLVIILNMARRDTPEYE